MPLKGTISQMIAELHRDNKKKGKEKGVGGKPRSNAQIAAIAYAVEKRRGE